MEIIASGSISSWQTGKKKVETTADFIFLGSKITVKGDCSHEIKRHLYLGRKAMTNLDSILKRRDITLLTKVPIVKEPGGLWSMGLQSLTWLSDWPTTTMVYTVVMYGCESWIIKKAEHWTIDAFELWCWRKLLRALWTLRRINKSILKKVNPEYSLEGLMLKLKLEYFGYLWKEPTHWKRLWCWEIFRARGEGSEWGWGGWIASLTQLTWIWTNARR